MIIVLHTHQIDTLWWTNIAIENGHLYWNFPINMVIFHCYVSSPEGISPLVAEKPIEDPVRQPSAGIPVVSGTQPAASFLRIFDAKRPVVCLLMHWAVAPDIFKHVCPKICGTTECWAAWKMNHFWVEANCTSVFRFQPLQHASRLIGRKFHDSPVQADMKHWPFKALGGNPQPPHWHRLFQVGWRSTDIWVCLKMLG